MKLSRRLEAARTTYHHELKCIVKEVAAGYPSEQEFWMLIPILVRQTGQTDFEVARRLGTSHTSMGRWLRGKTCPPPYSRADLLRKISAMI